MDEKYRKDYSMLLLILIISAILGLTGVALFEGLYQAFKQNQVLAQAGKALCCKIWWLIFCVFCLADGLSCFLFNILIFSAIALSHIDLAENKDSIIPIVEVIKNTPTALRQAGSRLKLFLK